MERLDRKLPDDPEDVWKGPINLPSISPIVDPIAIWQSLSPEAQTEIGIAAIVVGLGALGHDTSPAHPAALHCGIGALEHRVFDHVVVADILPRPDLAAIGVRMCRVCGCTDDFACPDGCSWIEDNLCSECGHDRRQ